jgi:hypothetical protein
MELIDKSAVVAEIERIKKEECPIYTYEGRIKLFYFERFLSFLDTIEVKEVDITSMADEYYDALIKEAEMDVDMAGHCRLAYYNGCRDVLNKIQKGE